MGQCVDDTEEIVVDHLQKVQTNFIPHENQEGTCVCTASVVEHTLNPWQQTAVVSLLLRLGAPGRSRGNRHLF